MKNKDQKPKIIKVKVKSGNIIEIKDHGTYFTGETNQKVPK